MAKESLFDRHKKLLRDRPDKEKSEVEKQLEQEQEILESIKQHKRKLLTIMLTLTPRHRAAVSGRAG